MRKNIKGFTMIEIMVVFVITSLLIAIASPALMGYITKAKDAALQANVRIPGLEIHTHILEQLQYFRGDREDFDMVQKYVEEKTMALYKDIKTGETEISTHFSTYRIKDIVIYYDGIDQYDKPVTLDPNIKQHYISKIGFQYIDIKDADKGFVAVFRTNEEIRIFHKFNFMADEKWAVSFS